VLRELHITGLGVFDDIDLELHPGLNVLTGETGAGKTMVTVGLSLALGARATGALVREGEDVARVQARFDAPDGAEEWAEDGELLLARSVGADGKSSARVGGQLATASVLVSLGATLVEVHGQGRAQGLLSAATQTDFLDRFAGDAHVAASSRYHRTWDGWRTAHATLRELTEAAREREREIALLDYQVREIETVGPRSGETRELVDEESRLAHVERLLERAAAAEEILAGETSLADNASAVAAILDDAARHDREAAALADRARGSAAELSELARDVRTYRESLLVDPDALQRIRERLGALKGLQRKYGDTDDDVRAFLEEASDRLAMLATADERLAELTGEVQQLSGELELCASAVTAGRTKAAPALAAALRHELHELGMPGAVVEVGLEPTDPGPAGVERVELRLAPSVGQRMAPLAKAASGGELSRTMLACRSVLADVDEVPTLVFDEVDAGIGGEAGLAVGRRLARLAGGRQVLVVTHLPQIACFADRHIVVAKQAGKARLRVLSDDERVRELSRMLAGLTGSEGAVTHAEELLAAASSTRTGLA
jgi:DNA repair protein RecN (Recombination protein N)